jgi:type II secretory ATPase GspE/PulE/Tfp pilus assembly ATPase PilB-like protein
MVVHFEDDKQDRKLKELRFEEEEELAQILAQRYGMRYADLTGLAVNTDALRLVSEEEARAGNVAVFDQVNKKVQIAVQSPSQDHTTAVIRSLEERGYTVIPVVVSMKSLQYAWERYKDLSFAIETKAGTLDISNDEIRDIMASIKTIDDVKKLVTDTMAMKKAFRVSRIVEIIIAGAIATKASDIHVEPEDAAVRLRYRLDGVLTDIILFDRETYLLLLSRLKLLAGVKLNIKNAAQDGRFSILIDKKEIEVRVSTLPGAYSESVVMRLLDPTSLSIGLDTLGMEPRLLEIMSNEIKKPNGLILNTGPTGSGKTTTLYAFLNRTKSSEVKVITIEDPIEYHLEGIVQTQVDPKKGYTFETGLKASLRQDPDIIMVGEIRDKPTAETSIQASLTGHLVYSTLHTNNAAGTFPRLIDIGVDASILNDSINVVMAQRLVRILCTSCRTKVPFDPKYTLKIKTILEEVNATMPECEIKTLPPDMWKAVGCPLCHGVGYKGRIAIFEVILKDPKLEEVLRTHASSHDIRVATKHQGILTMVQDGVLKALRGITTFEELERVVEINPEQL